MKQLKIRSLMVLAGLIIPAVGLAQDAPELNGANTAWILVSTALVLFMTLPGLALFYSGLVRSKNVLSVLMQCFTIACLMSILWLVLAYGLAFGDGGGMNSFIGMGKILLSGVGWDSLSGDIPESVFFMFQMTFAIITPALIVGGFAERMKFSRGTVVFMPVVVAGVRPRVPLGLGRRLARRYRIHGLCRRYGGAYQRRRSCDCRGDSAGQSQRFPGTAMPPHNMTLTVAGASMLWVGWFGFNAGSALAADGNAGMAMLVTHISAAAGSLAWVTCEWIKHGKPSVLGIVTGMVAGLGTITPASGFVGPLGGLLIGISPVSSVISPPSTSSAASKSMIPWMSSRCTGSAAHSASC